MKYSPCLRAPRLPSREYQRIDRARVTLIVVPALCFGLLGRAAAQVSDSPPAVPAAPEPSHNAVLKDTSTELRSTQSQPAAVPHSFGAKPPVPKAFKSGVPVQLLTTPTSTPVMRQPALAPPAGLGQQPVAGVPLGGNNSAGTVLPRTEQSLAEDSISGRGEAPAGVGSELPASPGVGAVPNGPGGMAAEVIPGDPSTTSSGGEMGEVPAPSIGNYPPVARTPEPASAVPATPLPVLPLSILYGVVLLFAAGYFWYTARLAQAENSRNA